MVSTLDYVVCIAFLQSPSPKKKDYEPLKTESEDTFPDDLMGRLAQRRNSEAVVPLQLALVRTSPIPGGRDSPTYVPKRRMSISVRAVYCQSDVMEWECFRFVCSLILLLESYRRIRN